MVKSIDRRLPALIALLIGCAAATAADDIVVRSNPQSYRLTLDFSFDPDVANPKLGRTVLNLPWPISDQYQDVERTGPTPGGYTLPHPETGNLYYHEELYARRGDLRDTFPVITRIDFDVTLYDIRIDFDAIGKIHPYLHNSSLYRMYTRNQKVYVDPEHPRIVAMANHLGRNKINLVDFARAAHLYVARHFKLLDAADAISPLEDVLKAGGGSEADLVSLYVSILRCGGIPARHLVGLTRTGAIHVMADFYLEHRGWIPVDVVKKIHRPHLDCFGVIEQDNVMAILSYDVGLTIQGSRPREKKTVGLMNTAYGDFDWDGNKSNIRADGETAGRAAKDDQPKTVFTMELEHFKMVREPEHVDQY